MGQKPPTPSEVSIQVMPACFPWAHNLTSSLWEPLPILFPPVPSPHAVMPTCFPSTLATWMSPVSSLRCRAPYMFTTGPQGPP